MSLSAAHQILSKKAQILTSVWLGACIFFALFLIYPIFTSTFGVSNMTLFALLIPMNLGLCLLWGHCGVLSFGQVADQIE